MYTRLYTFFTFIPRFALREKVALRLLKLLLYIWKLNQTVLELDFRAANFLFFTTRQKLKKI